MSRGIPGTVAMVVMMSVASPLASAEPSAEAKLYLNQLETNDAYAQQEAFLHLEALREPDTAPIVRQQLKSRKAQTRAFAVRAMAAIEGKHAVPELLARVQHEHPIVRVAALLALEPLQKQDPSIAPALIAALRDRKPMVRMAAVDIVSRIKQPDAREAILVRWKRERHRDVRRVLELAMKRIGEQSNE